MGAPALSVIVPTRNRASVLLRCLRSLEEQTAPAGSFEVIVVVDGSTEDTQRVLSEHRWHMPLVRLCQPHRGPNAARNRGAAVATGGLLLFWGDDMLAEPDVVALHIDAHARRAEEHVGVLGNIGWPPELPQTPFMRFLAGPDSPQFSFSGFDPADVPPGRMYGSHHSVKRSFFERHGGFDEALSLPAFDDIELEMRYRRSGFRLIYDPRPRAYHLHPYDLRSYCARMRMVGRAAVILARKIPGSAPVSGVGSFLRLRVTDEALDRRIAVLTGEEAALAQLPVDSAEYEAGFARLYPGWRQCMWEADALGAQEEAAAEGWTDLTQVPRRRGCVFGYTIPRRLSLNLGPRPCARGISVVAAPETDRWRATQVAGRAAVRIGSAAGGTTGYLHLAVRGEFTSACALPVRVTVTYLDAGACRWWLEYDATRGPETAIADLEAAIKRSDETVTNEGSGEWREATFVLRDWLFWRRLNGADLRLAVSDPAGDGLCVRRVAIEPVG